MQNTATLYSTFAHTGSDIKATAISVSGTTPTIGTQVARGLATIQSCNGAYSVGAAGCMVIYGLSTPAIKGDSIAITGSTTVAWGTASSAITVVAGTSQIPTAQLTATKLIATYASTTTAQNACCFSLSGTTVTANAELTLESSLTATIAPVYDTLSGMGSATANRYRPVLQPLTATTMLCQWTNNASAPISRASVISESSGTLTIPGGILYRSIAIDVSGNANSGYTIGMGSTEFMAVICSGVTGAFQYKLVPHNINGTAITFNYGEYISLEQTAANNGPLPVRFSNGNYAIYGTGSPT